MTMWCTGYVEREWVFVASAALISVVSLSFALIRIAHSARNGCPECPRYCCSCSCCPSSSSNYKTTVARPAEEVQLVGGPVASDDSPRVNNYVLPPDVPVQIVQPATIDITWYSNLMLAARLSFVILVALEPVMVQTAGQRLILMLTVASETSTLDAITREQRYRRQHGGLTPLASAITWTAYALTFACMVPTLLALGVTGSFIGDDLYVLHVTVAAVVTAIGTVFGAFMVSRAAELPSNKFNSVAQKVACSLMFVFTLGVGAITLYGSVLPRDEREVAAAVRGCYGDIEASHADLVVFAGNLGLIIDGALFLVLTSPLVQCRSALPSTGATPKHTM